jgi:hypothetical protein
MTALLQVSSQTLIACTTIERVPSPANLKFNMSQRGVPAVCRPSELAMSSQSTANVCAVLQAATVFVIVIVLLAPLVVDAVTVPDPALLMYP